jgi:hypothetical protein
MSILEGGDDRQRVELIAERLRSGSRSRTSERPVTVPASADSASSKPALTSGVPLAVVMTCESLVLRAASMRDDSDDELGWRDRAPPRVRSGRSGASPDPTQRRPPRPEEQARSPDAPRRLVGASLRAAERSATRADELLLIARLDVDDRRIDDVLVQVVGPAFRAPRQVDESTALAL